MCSTVELVNHVSGAYGSTCSRLYTTTELRIYYHAEIVDQWLTFGSLRDVALDAQGVIILQKLDPLFQEGHTAGRIQFYSGTYIMGGMSSYHFQGVVCTSGVNDDGSPWRGTTACKWKSTFLRPDQVASFLLLFLLHLIVY